VPVIERGGELAQLVVRLREREPAVDVDAQRLGADVLLRDVRVDASVDADRTGGDAPLALELGHRLVQQLDVELEADGGDVARLLGTEKLAGSSDLEVAHRDGEARAELGVVGERRQSSASLTGQLLRIRIEEVRVRGLIRAADAAADLVELREAEHVGTLDDERVRLRDVDARLDDRRRHEHVRVAAQERVHLFLELLFAHLAVRDEEAQVGAHLPQLLGGLLDRVDAVVEIERLTLAFDLALERELHELLVVLADGRSDRAASFGRRLDDGDVAHAGERQVQRPRDRRRAQREHVHLEAQRLEQLLLRDAEPLLLVEDDEAELLRDDVAAEHAVRADEHVDFAFGKVD